MSPTSQVQNPLPNAQAGREQKRFDVDSRVSGAKAKTRLGRYWPAWVTLMVGLAASAGMGLRLHRQSVELDRLRLKRLADVVLDRLQTKVQTTDLILRQAQDYFGSQERITDGMFREWCRKYGWSSTAPWMHGIALYTNLNAGDWRKVVSPDPATWTREDVRAFNEFARRTPIELKFAFGYCSDSTKRWPTNYARQWRYSERDKGIVDAVHYNTPRSTDRQLVIERAIGEPEYGATVAVPLYDVNRDELYGFLRGTPSKAAVYCYNWNLCRGLILAPIDYVTLQSLIWSNEPKEVGVEIYASQRPELEAWLNPVDHPPRAFDVAFHPYLTVSVPWKLYNQRWTLFVYTLPAFEAGSPRYMAQLTFAAGAAMTVLTTLLVGLGLRARHRQERMTMQIREARDALAAAQKERQKLSHDLHDNTIQSLYAVHLGLGRAAQKLAIEPDSASHGISVACTELDAVIAEIRRFITAEEGNNTAVDLSSVLHSLAQRARAKTAAQIELHCDPDASDRVSGTQAVQLANIAREALSNSLRHAKPQHVEIALRSEPEAVRLEISDDGAGFDPNSSARQGVGLTSMATRTKEMSGTLEVQSAPKGGTRVTVRVPVSAVEADRTESDEPEDI